MDRLLATADAFITNVRPRALRRLGLHHDDVLARHPKLVYGSLTGYGLEGPEADRAGYDVGAYWARSGLAHALGPAGSAAAGAAQRDGRPHDRADPGRRHRRQAARS